VIHQLVRYNIEGDEITAVFSGEAPDCIHRAFDKDGRLFINFDFCASLGFVAFRGGYIYGIILHVSNMYAEVGLSYELLIKGDWDLV